MLLLSGHSQAETAIPVRTIPVESRIAPEAFQFQGVVEPYQSAEISAQIDGVIERIHVVNGDPVKKGDLILEIDDSRQVLEAARASALLAEMQSVLNQKKLALDRAEELRRRKVGAVTQLQAAQSEYDVATAKTAVARSMSDLAELRLSRTKIWAPIDGRIAIQDLKLGSYIETDAGKPLATIFQTDPIKIVYSVPFDARLDILSVLNDRSQEEYERRANLSIILPGGIPYGQKGKHLFSSGVIDPLRGSMEVGAVFPNGSEILLPGAKVIVEVDLTDPEPILSVVPHDAVRSDGDGFYVFVVDPEASRLVRRPISILRNEGDTFLVTGVYGGEHVALGGDDTLSQGLLVQRPDKN